MACRYIKSGIVPALKNLSKYLPREASMDVRVTYKRYSWRGTYGGGLGARVWRLTGAGQPEWLPTSPGLPLLAWTQIPCRSDHHGFVYFATKSQRFSRAFSAQSPQSGPALLDRHERDALSFQSTVSGLQSLAFTFLLDTKHQRRSPPSPSWLVDLRDWLVPRR